MPKKKKKLNSINFFYMGKAHGCELFFLNENYQGFSNPKM